MTAPVEPGEGLLRLVAVMDTLLSPGGCPWDARQTHETLAPYVVEEAYELLEAISSGNPGDIADELGDVLLQVVFHARVAQAAGTFDIDVVADRIIDKLHRRHPHVFADVDAATPEQVEANWEAIKAKEKPERVGALDGIPLGMPPLERAAKTVSRLRRRGRQDVLAHVAGGTGLGERLLSLVVEASESGADPTVELNRALNKVEATALHKEFSRPGTDR